MNIVIFRISKLFVFSLFIFSCNKESRQKFEAVDGPYIYSDKNTLTSVTVEKVGDSGYYIQKIKMEKGTKEFISRVDNFDNDSFSFSVMDLHQVPPTIYPYQEKILVTSDNEGNFDSFYSLLVSNKVMNRNFSWTFGSGHLVIAGDMFDRGTNVVPCLWLLYKLEQEALKAGGQVHFVLGNHEVMNLQGDIRYVHPKYLELATTLSQNSDPKRAYLNLMSNTNILVQWIKSKNTVEKIGDILFLHGGISEEIIDANLSIEELNDIVRANIRNNLYKNPGDDKIANLVMGRLGPLWYRGLVKDYKHHYKKLNAASVDYILEFYDVKHIVIGHTIVSDKISSDFNGKVIRVDVKHPKEKFTGKSQALFIKNNRFFRVTDKGEQFELEFTD